MAAADEAAELGEAFGEARDSRSQKANTPAGSRSWNN